MADISDLDMAVMTLRTKAPYYNNLFNYYEGRHPLVYSRDKLSEIFSSINARFTENWCAVVIDAANDKIQLQRITIADDEAATDELDKILTASQLVLESEDVHLAALVTGESFVIAWPDEDTGEPEAYYNDPRNVHVFYEADHPRRKRYACKWWIGDDDYRYLTLYYPDRLEYYRSKNRVRRISNGSLAITNEVTSGKSFEQYDGADNPYDLVPVFHFRRDSRVIKSELQNVIEPQDAVNKLLSDMMIAAEFGAFPQRYIISQADSGKFKNAPNIIWDVPGSDGEGQQTEVGQFDPTQLSNYLESIDKWVMGIAIISRTPKHYFFGQGGDPSGEALIAMESPLNRKAQKYINRFTPVWSELAGFLAILGGMGVIDDNAIIPIFDKPETVQPYTQSLIRKESVAAGIPLMWQMKQEGYTEQELDELEDARTEEQDASTERLAQVMEQRTATLPPQPQPQQNGTAPVGNNAGQ